MQNSPLTLYELNRLIKNTLSEGFPDLFWVRAETSDVRVNQNGHCYLELIQKDGNNKNTIAKAKAAIWANVYFLLKSYFEQQAGQAFVSGLKVLVQVSVEFHELYGFSLIIHNIDPTYTLGDQALNRMEIIRQLKEDGVLELNKELELPEITNRIAIISSPTAAGYEDFLNQLNNNNHGFKFYTQLYPAIMQGEKTEASILAALEQIFENQDYFDIVAIIRGGGASSELSCFDSYLLAASCAQFPLPIITGIGHERDDTVLDIVAHTKVKTPTAVAEYLIDKMTISENELLTLQERIFETLKDILHHESLRVNMLSTHFSYLLKEHTKEQITHLQQLQNLITIATNNFLKSKSHLLEIKEQQLHLSSPENILKKGYSLTMHDNKIVKKLTCIKSGDNIKTILFDGEIESVVK